MNTGASGMTSGPAAAQHSLHAAHGIGIGGLALPRALEATRTADASGNVVGLDVGGTKVRAAMADLSGNVLAETERPTSGRDTAELIQQLTKLTQSLVESGTSPLRAVAVGCPGVVDPRTGAVGLSPNAPAVEGHHLKSTLEATLGVPVDLDNDVNLAAAAERWRGVAQDCDDFIFVNLGTGIGAGLVLAGDVYRGPHGGAGEIAHLPFDHTGLTPVTQLAAFEQAVWPRALQHRWIADPHSPKSTVPTPHRLLELASVQHPVASHVLAKEVKLLAAGVQVLASVLDPGLIVLGGGLGRNPVLTTALTDAMRDAALPVPISTTGLDEGGGALGAVLLAIGTTTPQWRDRRVTTRTEKPRDPPGA